MRQYNGGRQNVDTSRRVIDVAMGVLIGLRGYSEQQAFEELVEAMRSTGVGIGSLAAALVALVGGRSEDTPHLAEAMGFWGDTLASREIYSRAPTLITTQAS